jgi:branched-chain amino acid aminotransferase
LVDSAHILGLALPYTQQQLEEACIETVRRNRLRSCYIRPLAFLGDGEMGLAADNAVRVSVAAWHWGAYLGDRGVAEGIRVKTSSFQRFHVNTLMPRAKVVGHYVNSILASREVRALGYDEALLLDTNGLVAEGPGENIFVVRDGVVVTPPLASPLPGITRDTAMALLADLGVRILEGPLTRDAIYIADEVFMTGTAAEITPVRELDGRRIGDGRPGQVTQQMQRLYQEITRGPRGRERGWVTLVPA